MPQPQRGKASRMSSLKWLSHTTSLPSLDTQTAHLEAKLLPRGVASRTLSLVRLLKELNFFNTGLTNGPLGSGFSIARRGTSYDEPDPALRQQASARAGQTSGTLGSGLVFLRGEATRCHFWVGAQNVQRACTVLGSAPNLYTSWSSDKWCRATASTVSTVSTASTASTVTPRVYLECSSSEPRDSLECSSSFFARF